MEWTHKDDRQHHCRRDKTRVVAKPGDHQDVMISFGRDQTTSSLQGSEITCEPDHWIPMFPYPASWHNPPVPRPSSLWMACECLAAIDAALPGSGVKAKASLCSDKWARQDISTETQLKTLEKSTLIHIIFPFSLPQCWTHAKGPRNFFFIFVLFIHRIRSNPNLPGPDTGQIS